MKDKFSGIAMPLIAAMIWGVSFPAQAICIKYMTPFLINAIRSLLAAAVLALLVFVLVKMNKIEIGKWKDLILGSLACGVCLFLAVNLQQIGIADTDSGKAGFITALYTVLIPVIGIFIGIKTTKKVWSAVVLAVIGLYFLCVKNDFTIQPSDMTLMACAIFFAVQMTFINKFITKVDGIALSCGQFLVVGIISLIVSFFLEDWGMQDIGSALPALLYIALFSSCIAYTLQIISYKKGDPTVLALLFSLESVFAVIAGAIMLGEKLSVRELIGCVVMFAAVILAETPLQAEKVRAIGQKANIVKRIKERRSRK